MSSPAKNGHLRAGVIQPDRILVGRCEWWPRLLLLLLVVVVNKLLLGGW